MNQITYLASDEQAKNRGQELEDFQLNRFLVIRSLSWVNRVVK
jgi:hypothetical protein